MRKHLLFAAQIAAICFVIPSSVFAIDFDSLHSLGIKEPISSISGIYVTPPGDYAQIDIAQSAEKSDAGEVQNFVVDHHYAYRTDAERDGKIVANNLRTAGYKVQEESAWQYPGNHLWYYSIDYLPPVGNFAVKVQSYDSPQEYAYKTDAERDGKIEADKLKAAGYKILEEYAWQYPGNLSWCYSINYIPLAGSFAVVAQDYNLLHDYACKTDAERDGKIVADNLRAVGYKVLVEYAWQYPGDHLWCYSIKYIPPAGSFAEEFQYYDLWRDYDSNQYAYNTDAERGGKMFADNLRAAGYKILEEGSFKDFTNWWHYGIRYIPPIGNSAEKIQIYELSRGNDGKAYIYKSDAERDGKIMAANLKGSGYTILYERVVHYTGNTWSYWIDYINPVKK